MTSPNSVELTTRRLKLWYLKPRPQCIILLARRYRTLEFEELKSFPCDGLIIYAVRIVKAFAVPFRILSRKNKMKGDNVMFSYLYFSLKGEKDFKPRPQGKILVSLRGSIENFRDVPFVLVTRKSLPGILKISEKFPGPCYTGVPPGDFFLPQWMRFTSGYSFFNIFLPSWCTWSGVMLIVVKYGMIDSYAFVPFSGSPSGSCLLVVSAVFFPFTNTWESGSFARPLETELGTQCSRFSVSRYLELN